MSSIIGETVKKLFGKKDAEPPKKKGFDKMKCTAARCENKKEWPQDLCCKRCWNAVPANLKRLLWKAEKIRSFDEKEKAVMEAAQNILDYVEANVLPSPIITKGK